MTGQRISAWAFCIVLAAAISASPSLVHWNPDRLTNDEAMYAWKAARIAEHPAFVLDHEAWRRHPPGVPAVAALLAQALPIDSALAATAKLSLAAALLGIAAFAFVLAGPVAAASAATLLALDENTREFGAHLLLDLPLVALLGVAGAVAARSSRGVNPQAPPRRDHDDRLSLLALPIAALACLVKSYGTLVLAVFAAALVWERVGVRTRRFALGAVALGVLAMLGVGQLGWLRDRFYWLAPHDPLRTGAAKLYLIVQSFQWIDPDMRARTLAVLMLPVLALAARFLRFERRAHARLLAFAFVLPLAAVFVTRVIEKRTLFLVLAPLHVALGITLARSLAAIPQRALRRVATALLALAAPLLVLRNDALRPALDPCRYAGRAESAELLRTAVRPGDRVFSTATHQHRWYAGLEFERDGGPLHGDNEWTGVPHERADFEREARAARGASFLALDWNRDANPRWLAYDANTAMHVRALGFAIAGAVWLPEIPGCEQPLPERAAAEDAFYRAFGLSRERAGKQGREVLAAVVLRRAGEPPP